MPSRIPIPAPTLRRIRREARSAARREIALKLHVEGKTLAEIGAVLGISVTRALQMVRKAKRLISESEKGAPATLRRSIIRNAAKTCTQCAKSGCTLTAGVPVWRTRLPLGYGPFGRGQTKVAVCAQCVSKWRKFRPAAPCEGCGRPVHQEASYRSHRRTFCCEACERTARSTAARERRADARGTRQCETCGETFEPTRTNARFCSSPCRQRAYRQRIAVTDDECRASAAIVSRNAHEAGAAP
jgi:hypothetical protein